MTQHLTNYVARATVILGASADRGLSLSPLIWLVPLWLVVFGGIGAMVGKSRGHGLLGFLFGLTGPWGWFIASFLPKSRLRRWEEQQEFANALVAAKSVLDGEASLTTRNAEATDSRECPWCAELIKPAAVVCRFCGRDVESIGSSSRELPTDSASPSMPAPISVWAAPLSNASAGADEPSSTETSPITSPGAPRRRWLVGLGTLALAGAALLLTLTFRSGGGQYGDTTTTVLVDDSASNSVIVPSTEITFDPPPPPPPPPTTELGVPRVDAFTQVVVGQQQNMVFTGSGFGYLPTPFSGDTAAFRLFDATQGWNAGAPGDAITVVITEWTDTTIRIGGFSGRYAEVGRNWTVNSGDDIQIWISNPQTGRGPAKIEVEALGGAI